MSTNDKQIAQSTPAPWRILRAPNEGWGSHFLIVGSNYDRDKNPLVGVIHHAFDFGQSLTDWEHIVETVNRMAESMGKNGKQTALMKSIQRKKDKIEFYLVEIRKLNDLDDERTEGVSDVYSNAIACLKDEIAEDEKLLPTEKSGWKTFAERPDNPKTQVLIQHPDGSVGLWYYNVAEKWSDIHTLMWHELPSRYEYPKMVLTPKYGSDE